MRATATSLHLPPHSRLPTAEHSHGQAAAPASWLRRWFMRPEPTAYQRCLAVHIHYASPRSALS